jgi:hypothetical protein
VLLGKMTAGNGLAITYTFNKPATITRSTKRPYRAPCATPP